MKIKKNAASAPQKRTNSKHGAFSAGLTALAIVAVIVFNLLIAQIPTAKMQLDLTGSRIYQISQVSQDYLANLSEDVDVHVLADEAAVDARIVRFLSKYASLSDHVSVEYVNPTVYPSVLTKYDAQAGDVVVTCDATGRQESFSTSDVIGYDVMTYYTTGETKETDFDCEGLLTSAIDGVLTDAAFTVYQTNGHEETALPDNVQDLFSKVHMSVNDLNLLTDGGIPEDCDLLVLNAPLTDLADDERTMISDYLSTGGKVIYTMAPQDVQLPNFESLCADYGLQVEAGMIADTSRYYNNNPYLFFPVLDSSVDAASTLPSDATLMVYASRGMTTTTPVRDTITVSPFLTTSENGYAVVDEENKTQGTYTLGALATEEIDDGITARFLVYGSDSLVNSAIMTSFPSLQNSALYMAMATAGFEGVSNISIDAVSLSAPTNTITTGGLWAILFIFVIPLALLVFGFVQWMRRRKL